MSQLGNIPADNANTSPQSEALDKYWCFMCERDFNHAKVDSEEVFCPECNCISERIEAENDPRTFRPYDARREAPQTSQNTQANNTANSGQTNQNSNPQGPFPQVNAPIGLNVVFQTIAPMRSFNFQNFFPQMGQTQVNQNGGINQPQGNPGQNQPGAQQNQNIPQAGANTFNPLINNMFGMFSSIFSGAPMQGGLFGEMNSQIIEEFLRNDPNRHGPPPAPEESINRLKKSKFSGTCKVKDCPVCQDDYKDGDNLITLPCDHIFHKDCAEKWLKMHNSCPSCRKSLSEARDSYSENMFA